jgi:iron(III) transport system substrate-binding protein
MGTTDLPFTPDERIMNTTTNVPPRSRSLALGVLAALCLLSLVAVAGCPRTQPRVVLYCAQDEEFAKEILATFQQRTGIEPAPKFDTEADKSVSLYLELVQEKDRPRCDVFWNNEILSTIRLQRQGLLGPYASPSAKPYPASCRGPDDTWHAFAARPRILIVNTKLIKEADRPRSVLDLTKPEWKGRVAMAKPLYGTTATQAACLFEVLGKEKAEEFYRGLLANGVQVAPGNRQVAAWVGEGRAAVGMTDPDDAFEEMHDHPDGVAIVFPDADRPKDDRMGTLYIPNTVAIIKGSPDPDGARKLVDYLLSADIETKLAEGPSHQVPLNPEVKATLPKEMKTPQDVKTMDVDFARAAEMWDEVQTFLRQEFAR